MGHTRVPSLDSPITGNPNTKIKVNGKDFMAMQEMQEFVEFKSTEECITATSSKEFDPQSKLNWRKIRVNRKGVCVVGLRSLVAMQ